MIRVGTSGWNYAHWRERYYPRGLAASKWLGRYARDFDTVEINASFYRLQTRESCSKWRAETPAGFTFAVKGSRFITHMKRIGDVREPLRRFFTPVRGLGEKLGPVLWQLPPKMLPQEERLDAFLAMLPRGVPRVLEFRDPRWLIEPVFEVLRRHGAALCVMVHPALPDVRVPTGAFEYVRFHAPPSGAAFGAGRLARWASWLREQEREGRDAWVYFNNDHEGAAIEDARDLLRLLEKRRARLVA